MAEAETLGERKKRISKGFASIFSSRQKAGKIDEKAEEAMAEKIKDIEKEDIKKVEQNEKKKQKEIKKAKPVPGIQIKKDVIEIRKGEILSKIVNIFKKSPEFFYYLCLLILIWIGTWIRTRNLHLVQEGVFPADPDSALFLRYMQTIVEQGTLPVLDNLRYVPVGFVTGAEARFFPYVLAYIYKIAHFFNSGISVLRVDVLYPIILLPFILIAFFFLVKKIFDWKVALVSSAFLAVIPVFLRRTMLGFSDKEPLGILLFFLVFYFLVSAWKEKKLVPAIIYGLLAGLFSGLLGLTWGAISFVFMIVGLTFFFILLIGNFKKKDFAVYLAYILVLLPILSGLSTRFAMKYFLTEPTSGIVFVPLIGFVIYFILTNKFKEKLFFGLPHNITSIIMTGIIGILGLIAFRGPGFLLGLWANIKLHLLHPFGVIRLTLTVAENQQPFIDTWMSSFGYLFWLMILGAILLCFFIFLPLGKKYSLPLTIISSVFIISLIFSRYKSSPIDFGLFKVLLNGTNAISQVVFFGGMTLFMIAILFFYFKAFYKDKEFFARFAHIDKALIFTLIWFVWLAIGARGAIRLLFLFSPIVVVLGSLLLVRACEFGIKLKDKIFKYGIIILTIVIFLLLFNNAIDRSTSQTEGSYPHLNPQWINAMNWVREYTPEDAVFAHWWDYGYWVQTAGKRATILDGGNAYPVWDYFMGRFVLTSPSDDDALEFLYTHNATHLLIDSSDIGKYPAYSTIGSDPSYDRFSWISQFKLDERATQETREGAIYLYAGGTALDEDFNWQGESFAEGATGIAGFFVPAVKQVESVSFSKPTAVFVKNNKRFDVPLNCVYFRGQTINFEGEGLDGCLYIYPKLSPNRQLDDIGSAFYLSPRVRKSLLARLYFFEEDNQYFKLVRVEENLVVTDLRLQGANIPSITDFNGAKAPMKIWEISYPSDIKSNPEYLEKEFRDREVMLSRGYY